MIVLSVMEISKAPQKDRMARRTGIMVAKLWAYITFRAGGMGKIERLAQFRG